MNNTNTLLALTFAAVVALFGYMIYENNQDTPAENMAESFGELTEEIGDEIDDNTTN